MSMHAYDRVRAARNGSRPTGLDYIEHLFTDFLELHGDRRYGDDAAIVGGVAWLDACPVTVIAIEKGHTARERTARSFGAPNPEGYRKALRLMKQAEKFGRPVITFIDTPGAYPGMEAEERGQGEAIARNLAEMSRLRVPVISIVTGEGSSGGAQRDTKTLFERIDRELLQALRALDGKDADTLVRERYAKYRRIGLA